MTDQIVFVTNDKWILQDGGNLDITDREILEETGQGAEVVKMTPKQAFEAMRKQDPKQFSDLRKRVKGKRLTLDELVDIAISGDRVKSFFGMYVDVMLTESQARMIRDWRINERYTWRKVARASFAMASTRQWAGWNLWEPPSNQIMGLSLCEKAAELLNQHFLFPPWN
jgi:hypothetical protein